MNAVERAIDRLRLLDLAERSFGSTTTRLTAPSAEAIVNRAKEFEKWVMEGVD